MERQTELHAQAKQAYATPHSSRSEDCLYSPLLALVLKQKRWPELSPGVCNSTLRVIRQLPGGPNR